MDKTEFAVRRMLFAIEAPLYDVGVLSSRGMLPGLDALSASAVLGEVYAFSSSAMPEARTSTSGPPASTPTRCLTILMKPSSPGSPPMASSPVPSSRPAAATSRPGSNTSPCSPNSSAPSPPKTLAARYGADPSAADWRRFGRLPGFTNCKSKYKRDDGLFPFVRLQSHSGQQFSRAQAFLEEITAAYEARERQREQRRAERVLSPQRGPRSLPSLERFRTSARFADRPAAADIAFCVAAYSCGMDEIRMEQALTDEYLSRNPSPSTRAAYIRRTMNKARNWVAR